MAMSNFRLPEIERPSEKILKDDDDKIMAALKVVLDVYKRAQNRTRTITKAYNELESITRSILEKYHEEKGTSEKSEVRKSLLDKNTIRVQTSTPGIPDNQRKRIDCGGWGIETIDLETLIDRAVEPRETLSRDANPIFGGRWDGVSKKRKLSAHESPKGDSNKNCAIEIVATSSKILKDQKKPGESMEYETDDEENRPPSSIDNIPFGNDSITPQHESKPWLKIGLAKSVYNIEKRKTPNRKSMKQSTLVFQPIATKTDLTLLEKPMDDDPKLSRGAIDLFDKNYRTKKTNTNSDKSITTKINHDLEESRQSSKTSDQQNSPIFLNDNTEMNIPARNEEENNRDGRSSRSKLNFAVPSASQINETAQSLFEDEDVDNFHLPPDILNTCVESNFFDVSQSITNKELPKSRKSLNRGKTSPKESQLPGDADSIDETFFAPAEINGTQIALEESIPLAHCSKIADGTDNNHRTLKRKSTDQPDVEDTEIPDDLDVEWNSEFSNEEWTSPKAPFNNSFDLPPEKTKKCPEYAHKEKVERNQAKRSKLRGWTCWQCEKYYANMNLPEAELKKRMDACSRHRSKYNPRYFTPKNFWNPEFPVTTDSSDCSDDEMHKRD